MNRTSPSAASKAGLLGSLRRNTQDRPFLKLCERCKGKGQLSYFNNQQVKVYVSLRVTLCWHACSLQRVHDDRLPCMSCMQSACDDCSKGEENALFRFGHSSARSLNKQ